ncbi:MAG: hypothetical protein WKH64_02850 [Chloroflexia bacterium]
MTTQILEAGKHVHSEAARTLPRHAEGWLLAKKVTAGFARRAR